MLAELAVLMLADSIGSECRLSSCVVLLDSLQNAFSPISLLYSL
jgi:hypothetical protein